MEVVVSFKNKKFTIKLEEGATVGALNKEIEKEFKIKPENQKIICRGKPLKNPEDPIQGGMKLLLMEQAGPVIVTNKSTTTSRPYSLFKPTIIDTLKETYHQKIIQTGPPEGFTKPCQFQSQILPPTPLYVKNTEGKRCVMSVESDAICLISDDVQVERIFFTDITRASTIPIPANNGFVALGIITKAGNKWIYFIPQQFQNILKSLLPV